VLRDIDGLEKVYLPTHCHVFLVLLSAGIPHFKDIPLLVVN
jgi:hypothetical protein